MSRNQRTVNNKQRGTLSRGKNSRLPFAVNVMLNLSINNFVEETLRSAAALRPCLHGVGDPGLVG